MDQTLAKWIESHPYLLPIARVQEIVAHAATQPGGAPAWTEGPPDGYADEYARGVPLMHSAFWKPDLTASVEAMDRIMEALAEAPVANELRAEVRELRERFGREAHPRRAALEWLVRGAPADGAPPMPGLVRFLGWSALRAGLGPSLSAFDVWRGTGEGWVRGYCPACGAQPAVARLSPGDALRHRSMICACCASEWRFRRIGCPHCDNDDSDKLSVLEVEGDEGLRIDTCEQCKGYVKTYGGNDPNPALLADWTTLHLDLLAKERGYKRFGASLVEV